MNKKLKIYLDTSVINFLFADDAPEFKKVTIDFFEHFIKTGYYDSYISPFVIEEINATRNEIKREILLSVIRDYPINILSNLPIDEIQAVSELYIAHKLIPQKNYMDAYHIATSILSNIDYLISWNFKHLANIKKENQIKIVNLSNNIIDELRIITPLELMDYGNSNF